MKPSALLPTVFLLSYASAFPSNAGLGLADISKDLKERRVAFNPVDQKVDVTGAHAFIPPGPSDTRGPCPGLNALANHGYIARSGFTSLLEVIDAGIRVFGFGADLMVPLRMPLRPSPTPSITDLNSGTSAAGVVFTGNPVTATFSIGGPPPPTLLDPIFVTPAQGLSGSRNVYESDTSATRGDAYLFGGDASSVRAEYVEMILAGSNGVDDYTPSGPWTAHRKARFEDSVSKNPYFFFAPFSGILVSEAGIILPRELYANRSAAEPDKGVPPADVLLSFYGCAESGSGGGALDCPKGTRESPITGTAALRWLRSRSPGSWRRSRSSSRSIRRPAALAGTRGL